MKRRVVSILLLAVSVTGCALAPRVVESRIPTAYYIRPSVRAYDNVVSCSGTVQSESVRQVYLRSPVTAEEVFVAVGDTVKTGDLLVKLDGDASESMAVLPVSMIRDLSDELSPGANGADWAALAASYGLSAAVSGGSGMDAAALGELVSQSSLDQVEGVLAEPIPDGEIIAPMDGVVTEVAIQKGVPPTVGKAIVTIADNQNYRVMAAVREEDVARVQLDNTVTVRGVGFGGTEYAGRVTKIYPTARKTISGTTSETVVDVEIRLDNGDKRLKPGFTAKVEISGGSDYDLITVPYEAIRQDENNDEYLYLYENGRMVKRLVTTGKELTSEVEILDGVTTDSIVVMNPSDAAREGAMIRIKGQAHGA